MISLSSRLSLGSVCSNQLLSVIGTKLSSSTTTRLSTSSKSTTTINNDSINSSFPNHIPITFCSTHNKLQYSTVATPTPTYHFHHRDFGSSSIISTASVPSSSSSSVAFPVPPSPLPLPSSQPVHGLYDTTYSASLSHPNKFWYDEAVKYLHWTQIGKKSLTYIEPPTDNSGPSLGHSIIPTDTPTRPYDYRWFADGWKTNACFNMLDRHVLEGRGDDICLITDSAHSLVTQHISYRSMLGQVSLLSGALVHAGVRKGDRVLIYMPMISETVVAMLACSRLGAVHSVVFGGFAAPELAKRIQDAKPIVVLTASCGVEHANKIIPYKPALDEAIRIAKHEPKKVLVWQREAFMTVNTSATSKEWTKGRDEDWVEYVSKYGKETACIETAATDPLYILYTSGTTGTPKGVVRDVGSIVAALWSMKGVYGHKREEVFWSASDLGWAVGHTYCVYAPFLYGTTSLLYEGKPTGPCLRMMPHGHQEDGEEVADENNKLTEGPTQFWRVISQHKVAILNTAPTAIRAIKKEDASAALLLKTGYDLSSLRALFLAGERADPNTIEWISALLNNPLVRKSASTITTGSTSNQLRAPHVPVIDHAWQTESGWPMIANPRGLDDSIAIKPGSATFPMVGWELKVVDDEGMEIERGKEGNLVMKLPLPPSGVHTLWLNHARFISSYMQRFNGYYDTADSGLIDADGYVFVLNRSDDVLNVAGHRLSSGQIEEVLSSHPAVAESAIVAVPDALRGHVPVGLVVLKLLPSASSSSSSSSPISEKTLESEIVSLVRHRVGPLACLHRIIIVPRLPKTRSGKILRNVLRSLAAGEDEPKIPPTIEDSTVIQEIKEIMRKGGIIVKLDKKDI